MVDFTRATEIVEICFWLSAIVSVAFILEIMLGDLARDSLRRLFKQDDAEGGPK